MDTPAAALRAFFERSAPRPLVSAYLFGSTARGAENAESDVDVGVLFESEPRTDRATRRELRIGLTSELIRVLGRNAVDVVVLNDAPPGLGRHVVTRGRRVYCGDAEADHAFVRDVQLRAADLEPFLRRMRRNLGSLGEFPPDLVESLARLPGFRNVLLHVYVELDYAVAVAALDELQPIARFVGIVADLEADPDA